MISVEQVMLLRDTAAQAGPSAQDCCGHGYLGQILSWFCCLCRSRRRGSASPACPGTSFQHQ